MTDNTTFNFFRKQLTTVSIKERMSLLHTLEIEATGAITGSWLEFSNSLNNLFSSRLACYYVQTNEDWTLVEARRKT